MTYKPIKKWPVNERPVERLLQFGPAALTEAELIGILFSNGLPHRSAIDLARSVLNLGNLETLACMNPADLTKLEGIGPQKAARLIAALELSRRRTSQKPPARISVKSPEHVVRFLEPLLKDERREVFVVLFLNQALHLRHWERMSIGGITGTTVDPRLILRKALEYLATHLILCHNHPSGALQPSPADIETTEKIRHAAQQMDIRLLDHIIVSDQGWYSFANEGKLEKKYRTR
jgi:DNA repair protein RadC